MFDKSWTVAFAAGQAPIVVSIDIGPMPQDLDAEYMVEAWQDYAHPFTLAAPQNAASSLTLIYDGIRDLAGVNNDIGATGICDAMLVVPGSGGNGKVRWRDPSNKLTVALLSTNSAFVTQFVTVRVFQTK